MQVFVMVKASMGGKVSQVWEEKASQESNKMQVCKIPSIDGGK